MLKTIIFVAGAFDTVMILGCGSAAAVIRIIKPDSDEWFYNRVLPACGILVVASFCAAISMAITQALAG